MPFCPHSACPEQGHMKASRKSQDFPSIHSHGRVAASCNRVDRLLRREISLPHIMTLGKTGGSSKEGCTQMLTWGMKAAPSCRWHVGAGLRLGSLQASTAKACKHRHTVSILHLWFCGNALHTVCKVFGSPICFICQNWYTWLPGSFRFLLFGVLVVFFCLG